jgi:hypothetical protein
MSYDPNAVPNAIFADLTTILGQIKDWSVNRHSEIYVQISHITSNITALQTLTSSNDLDLDTVQEIVDAIKNVQTNLNNILVNDLTTGGVTKALTAEQGKILKGLIDDLNAGATALTARVATLETKVADLESEQLLMKQESANFQTKFNELAAENGTRFQG